MIDGVLKKGYTTEKGKQAECTENAISTLGKCIYHHGAGVPPSAVLDGFLAQLPLTTDQEEAQACHKLFLQ